MIKVGLTGRSSSGKTTIANRLKEMGAEVLNVDDLAKDIVEPGSDVLNDLKEVFGDSIVDNQGFLRRAAVADIVFNSGEKLQKLDDIMFPRMLEGAKEWLFKISDKCEIAIIDAAILSQCGMDKLVDIVVTTIADEDVMIKRIMRRDSLDKERAQSRINSQKPNSYYISQADIVIDTTNGIEDKINVLRDVLLSYDDKSNRPVYL